MKTIKWQLDREGHYTVKSGYHKEIKIQNQMGCNENSNTNKNEEVNNTNIEINSIREIGENNNNENNENNNSININS